ncbi:Sugar phosphate permease [Marinobacter daqiaonensis]|uniref:Sugar phosphate permease n=1 Tax=Marinobacter daqiaonensis TaxID=650891 RepID=A0A1I6J6J1_9GAMM|nr:MFS transporter [Marinobacter daqiaonensis]SFR74565.1 Sugar phosphate permease [Marinobacter daqiaonensis]
MTQDTRPPLPLMVATGMMCTITLVVFARLAYGLVLPGMRDGMGLSYAQAANLGTVTALGYLTLLMVAGVFASRYGGKQAIFLGLCFAAFGFTGLALSDNYWLSMMMMAMLGFGTAFGYTPLISLLGSWYPEKRGAVIGFANGGVGLGLFIAGALVPWLTTRFPEEGWRLVWGVFAIAALTVALVVAAFLRNPPRGGGSGSPSEPVPAARSGVYRNAHVINVGLIYGVVGTTYIVQTIFMFSYALESGVPTLTAGRLAAGMGLLGMIAGPFWGWISDRLGRSNALVLCMTFCSGAMALPVISPTLPAFAAHYIIMGLCVSGLFTSVLAASTETVHPRLAPIAVSYVTLFFAIGQLIGPAAAGLVIEWTGGFQVVFAITSSIMAFGVLLCWYSRKSQQRMLAGSGRGGSRNTTLAPAAKAPGE